MGIDLEKDKLVILLKTSIVSQEVNKGESW